MGGLEEWPANSRRCRRWASGGTGRSLDLLFGKPLLICRFPERIPVSGRGIKAARGIAIFFVGPKKSERTRDTDCLSREAGSPGPAQSWKKRFLLRRGISRRPPDGRRASQIERDAEEQPRPIFISRGNSSLKRCFRGNSVSY